VRVGTGIFVTLPPELRAPAPQAAVGDSGVGPFELLAARAVIEGETAALAAKHARKADFVALRQTIVRMREHAEDDAERDTADRAFHVRIAEATRNGALAHAVAGLWDLRRGDLWSRIEVHFHTAALRAKTLADHEAIVAALAARDAAGARKAMHRHLERVAREFQRRWDEPAEGIRGAGAARGAKARGKPSQHRAARRNREEGAPS
jgi:DNA-binding FadR family transcriptional regulator